jgi:RecA/RadA recombinase
MAKGSKKSLTEQVSGSSLVASFVADLGDDSFSVAAEGKHSAEFTGYIDTGSYVLNALISGGKMKEGGIPNNKAVMFAGESSTGKTFFILSLMNAFLNSVANGGILAALSESAITNQMMQNRGIDIGRVAVYEPETVREYRDKTVKAMKRIEGSKNPIPFLHILDSLGQLSTDKEILDAEKESDKKDMTRPGQIRSAFRTIRLRIAKLKIPMIITNHTYITPGQGPVPAKQTLAGGGGAIYAADAILLLSKKDVYNKKTKEVTGVEIKIKTIKSRFAKEKQSVIVYVDFASGLDRWYGLKELALDAGIFKKKRKTADKNAPKKSAYEKQLEKEKEKEENNSYEIVCDGRVVDDLTIKANPESVFTDEILGLLENHCANKFAYGGRTVAEDSVDADQEAADLIGDITDIVDEDDQDPEADIGE